ncbi:hypothetical protein HK099_003805 [Clydaea vesicula]|uniref:Uncharacterized protein n=1 Tax=Clydaea vesicula TaxID=447962 RepID=A0AAD5U406_9FUNG|nr:hypothetical protein HK099_003805 [Clydaea vesicula]
MLIKLRETKSDIMDSMEPRDFIPPSSYDVLLSDVKHNDLIGPIAERLGIVYLKEVATRTDSSTKGILYGKNAKPMVNLTIASTKHKRFINVIFLVDTGSPYLYICEKAMNALGFSDHCPETFDITFRDMTFEAVVSPLKQPNGEDGHYKDINLIGASFLSKVRAKFIVDYKINEVKYIDQIALYQASKIFTNIAVNIQEHFVPKIKKFISNLIIQNQESLLPEKMLKKDWIKVLQARSRLVQKIILENIMDISEYELTILNLLRSILPETIEKNSVFMIHIRFDTNILIKVVLGLGGKITKGTLNVEDNLEDIWNKLFNLKKKPFKPRNGKVFSGSIETDGVSITGLEEQNECLPKQNVYGKNGLRNQNIPIPSRKLLDPIAFRIYLKDYLYRFTQLELHYKKLIFRNNFIAWS